MHRPIRSLLASFAVLATGLASCGSAEKNVSSAPASGGATAYFAGGCFWCVESDFEHVAGVSEAVSGYAGADMQNPTYKNHGDHAEYVEVRYDPSKVSYSQLVDTFFKTIDPFAVNAQFCDKGRAYRSGILYSTDAEKKVAEAAKAAVEAKFGKPVATEIVALKKFWVAEDYHQDYYKKNKIRYKYYRGGCGRDARVREIWGEEAGGLSSHYK